MTRTTQLAIALAGICICATPARAWHTQLTEELELDLETHIAAGYGVVVLEGESTTVTHEPYLRMGRLRSRLALEGAGWAMFQVDIAGGQPRLLDAVAALTPTEHLTLRVGQFKAPLSADFLVPLPNHPLTTRPILVRHVPRRRLGVDATARIPIGRVRLDLELGLFAQEETPDIDGGKLLTARAGLLLAEGLRLHVGYGQLVLSGNSANPTTGSRPMPYDRLIDAAVVFEDEHVTAHAEGLFVLDGPDHHSCWGATAMIGYSFGDRNGDFAAQPVLAYDIWHGSHEVEHRPGGALNFYFAASHVVLRLDYEASIREGQVGHGVMLEIQMSF